MLAKASNAAADRRGGHDLVEAAADQLVGPVAEEPLDRGADPADRCRSRRASRSGRSSGRPATTNISGVGTDGLDQLDAVAERVVGVDPVHAGHVVGRPHLAAGGDDALRTSTSRSSTSSAGWALRAGWNGSSTPRCSLTRRALEPAAAPHGQRRRLRDALEAEHARRRSRSAAASASSPAGHGQLDVVEPERAMAAARPAGSAGVLASDDVEGAAGLEPLDLLGAEACGWPRSRRWCRRACGSCTAPGVSGARSARPCTLMRSSSPIWS